MRERKRPVAERNRERYLTKREKKVIPRQLAESISALGDLGGKRTADDFPDGLSASANFPRTFLATRQNDVRITNTEERYATKIGTLFTPVRAKSRDVFSPRFAPLRLLRYDVTARLILAVITDADEASICTIYYLSPI